jgi:hypothetical protein
MESRAGQAVEAAGEEPGEVRGEGSGAGVVGEHSRAVLEGGVVGLDDEVAVPLFEQVKGAGYGTLANASTPVSGSSPSKLLTMATPYSSGMWPTRTPTRPFDRYAGR